MKNTRFIVHSLSSSSTPVELPSRSASNKASTSQHCSTALDLPRRTCCYFSHMFMPYHSPVQFSSSSRSSSNHMISLSQSTITADAPRQTRQQPILIYMLPLRQRRVATIP
ncbi:hypothetical protein Scep_023967 [Stephania cephalantha]|uniref:Uncharacterized protein n=1 Tax=Stephania cephalantha TaxID=152367 RepID=A0AAP0EYJ8_9MAGN